MIYFSPLECRVNFLSKTQQVAKLRGRAGVLMQKRLLPRRQTLTPWQTRCTHV